MCLMPNCLGISHWTHIFENGHPVGLDFDYVKSVSKTNRDIIELFIISTNLADFKHFY